MNKQTSTIKPVNRKIYYRKATFNSDSEFTLQQLLSNALGQLTLVKDRSEPIDSNGKEVRLIRRHCLTGKALCGSLAAYERGKFQTVILDDQNATDLSISALNPPKKGPLTQEFLPGVLYFVVFNDHVALLQGNSIRASALENHISWLLRSKTAILNSKQGFVLKDEPTPATRARIQKSHVRSVCIGRPLMDETIIESIPSQVNASGVNSASEPVKKFRSDNIFTDLIKGLLEDSDKFEKLGLDDTLHDANLEIWIEIRHPKRSKIQTVDSIALLDNIGIALRDIDDDQAKLRLKDGSLVTGKDLKISGDLSVTVDALGLPIEADLFTQMLGWLEKQIKDGVIDPE